MKLVEAGMSNNAVLSALCAQIVAACADARYQAAFQKAQDIFTDKEGDEKLKSMLNSLATKEEQVSDLVKRVEEKSSAPDLIPPGPPQEPTDHPELHGWAREEIQDAVIDGSVGKLVFCLCSKDVSVRKESLNQIRSLSEKLKVGNALRRSSTKLTELRLPRMPNVSRNIYSWESCARLQRI